MKKKVTIFLFSLLCFLGRNKAQGVDFQASLADAFAKAKTEHKLVFVEYYNENCHVCQRLKPLFSDSSLSVFYNKNFVNYQLNTENIKAENKEFMEKAGLKPDAVPMFFFFDEDKKFCHFAHPQHDVEELILIGRNALDENERSANLEKKYNLGDRSIKTLYAYSNLAQLYGKDSLTNVLADDLYNSFPKKNLGNKKSYLITKSCVFTLENGFFRFWITHLDQLKDFETEKKVGKEKLVLSNILGKTINSEAAKNWDLKKIDTIKSYIVLLDYSPTPDVFFWKREAQLLFEAQRNNDALALCYRLTHQAKSDASSDFYYFSFFLDNLKEKKDLETLKPWIDEKSRLANTPTDISNFQTLYLHYKEKISDNSNAK